MAAIAAKLIGPLTLGSGRVHTVYKIEVTQNGNSWFIFRRYSAFEELHKDLIAAYNLDKLKSHNVVFPVKSYVGSVGGSLDFLVEKRVSILQLYLKNMLTITGVERNELVALFFDLTNKGMSGIMFQMGSGKVLQESFVRTKYVKRYLGVWATHYVVLITTGFILVLPSKYDNSGKAELNMCVRDGACTFESIPLNNQILITENGSRSAKLFLSFDSPEEAAVWMTALSDMTGRISSPDKDKRSQNNTADRGTTDGVVNQQQRGNPDDL